MVNGVGNDDKSREKVGIIKTKTKNRNNDEGERKKNIIKDNEFIKDKSRNIGLGEQDIDRIIKECKAKSGIYPPEDLMWRSRKAGWQPGAK